MNMEASILFNLVSVSMSTVPCCLSYLGATFACHASVTLELSRKARGRDHLSTCGQMSRLARLSLRHHSAQVGPGNTYVCVDHDLPNDESSARRHACKVDVRGKADNSSLLDIAGVLVSGDFMSET
ncbi:hypothetical protein C8Q78DRAFT_844492 [Trametes maxima]|nr:hypothetical protein C8Q78DRAFT_844492 [Trametes maxima]